MIDVYIYYRGDSGLVGSSYTNPRVGGMIPLNQLTLSLFLSSPAQYPNNRNKVTVLAYTESNNEAIWQRNSTDFCAAVFSHEGWADKTLLDRRNTCDIRLNEAPFYFK